MNRRFYLVLSIAILMGIQPVFAQQDESEATTEEVIVEEVIVEEVIAEEKTVRTESTIDMDSVSDHEFTEAVKSSSDIELINKNDVQLSEKESPAEKPDIAEGAPTGTEQKTPGSIRNNEYLQESQRLAKLAEDAYEFGDYDASSSFAEAAIRAAELSDEYVTQEAGVPITVGVSDALPAKYTVRAWNVSHDCFWNIAGRPEVYGNPRQWRVLYNANKAKLPDPNNPNLIEPGIVLDIPSLKGEVRQGAWDKNKTYKPLKK